MTIQKAAVCSLWGLLLTLVASCVCAQVPEHEEAFQAALDSIESGEAALEDAAGKLASNTSEEHVRFLKEQALKGGKAMALALEVLKRMDSAAAIKALVELSDNRWFAPLVVEALADRPGAEAKNALEEIAVNPLPRYGRHLAMVALLWRGDEETPGKLKGTLTARAGLGASFALAIARRIIKDHVAELETEEQKQQWRLCVMELTAAELEANRFRGVAAGANRMAAQLHQRREFPFELLRLYVEEASNPSLVAMALMGLQKEERAVPILEKILETYGQHKGFHAKIVNIALARIAEPEADTDSDE